MANNDFSAQSPENYEQKCLCVLVLDVSGSMSGSKIDELNKGLKNFHADIENDDTTANRLEISVIEFSDTIDCIQEPALVDDFVMPTLTTKGTTRMVDGIEAGIDKVRGRKQWYKDTGQPYYRPWIILMTDGFPDGGQDVNSLASKIKKDTANNAYLFFAIGVDGANMDTLKTLSSDNMPPASLQGLKFSQFFKWLSDSMGAVASSKEGDLIDMPDPSDWMKGFKV